jgi:NADPH:quinone reductase-like Zn-dependent oxidoreductase
MTTTTGREATMSSGMSSGPDATNRPTTGRTMRAVLHERYGGPDVLRVGHADVPAVGDDEVLVRVHAAGVDPGVWFFLTGKPYLVRAVNGLRRPRRPVLGRAVAGRVETVGDAVTAWRPGDEVMAELTGGGYAEYVVAPASALARKPAGLTFAQAAALPLSGTAALQGLRDAGRVEPGRHVLVNGASGGVGTFAVQLAAALGAEVTAVCSTRNADLVRSIGAHHVVDHTREDYTAGGARYDVVLDLVGNHSIRRNRRALAAGGTLVLSAGPPAPSVRRALGALALSPFVGHRLAPLFAKPVAADLDVLRDYVEAGELTPVIDRTYDLADTAEALRHQGEGHARGKTVVTV